VILRVPGVLDHRGCALRTFLVVNGQSVGEVWRDLQADDRGLVPECLTGFLDWYERWLDERISE
jgi:hypothetical protein